MNASSDLSDSYNSLQTTDLSIRFIHCHLDKLVLFCVFEPLDLLFYRLTKTFGKPKDQSKLGSIKRRRTYKRGKDKVVIEYVPDGSCCSMTLHDLHGDFQEQVNEVLIQLNIEPWVSCIELAWDFYGQETQWIKDFLKRHVAIRYARSNPMTYENTFYPSERRGSVSYRSQAYGRGRIQNGRVDAEARFSGNMINDIKHIHLVGIGGAAMSGIAEILLSSGYSVSGSDPTQNQRQQGG